MTKEDKGPVLVEVQKGFVGLGDLANESFNGLRQLAQNLQSSCAETIASAAPAPAPMPTPTPGTLGDLAPRGD